MIVIALAVAFSSCSRSTESKLVGSWKWQGCDDAGEVVYRADHTFTSRDWPPVVVDAGAWHVRGDQLVMDFQGDTRPAGKKHIELPLMFFDRDTFVVRTTDSKVHAFERLK